MAEYPPYNNVIAVDPQLMDPENGDYRPAPGSAAEGYGCETFPDGGYFLRQEAPIRNYAIAEYREKQLEVLGTIEVDTIWSADTVSVVGDVKVLDGVTLTVPAGCRVEFDGHYTLDVQGRLLALGTAEDRVSFTSADPSGFAIDSTLVGAWNGLRFVSTPATNGRSRLEYCVIEYSKALRDTAMVGALEVDRFSQLDIVNTIIRHNVADWGAAVYCIGFAAPNLVGCLITDNVAFQGGSAIYSTDAYPRIMASTITGNYDMNPEPYAPAAPIMSMVSKPQISNSILWNNFTSYLWPLELYEVKEYYTRYCDIERGFDGEGCFDLQPEFIGEGKHPYGISESSPCVDAGSAETTGMNLPPRDLAGRPRVQGVRLDVGAYEGNPETGAPEFMAEARMLLRAYPNPFNPNVEIQFSLSERESVSLSIYNLEGRHVRELYSSVVLESGAHRVNWDGKDGSGDSVASGLYIARIDANGSAAAVKLMLLK